ncbi:MAG: hypothetical protein HY097_00070 [Nitrospinae bacterium]|nr:hypothetical protein [Nitrospinota bacterium]
MALSVGAAGYVFAHGKGGMEPGPHGMMGGKMMEHKAEHHKMMNDLMQSVADLSSVVKESVTDKAAKDKCDAIIGKIGELIKKHDEMMKSHQEQMGQPKEKMDCPLAGTPDCPMEKMKTGGDKEKKI